MVFCGDRGGGGDFDSGMVVTRRTDVMDYTRRVAMAGVHFMGVHCWCLDNPQDHCVGIAMVMQNTFAIFECQSW